MLAWAPSTRCSIDRCGSPKLAIAKIVVQTIVIAMMNVATAVNAERRRDAVQGSLGKKTSNAHTRDTTASAKTPSAISRRGGRLRVNDASPIARGATTMVPSASDENQCSQITRGDAADP